MPIDRRLEFVVEVLETLSLNVRQCFLRHAVEHELTPHQHDDFVKELHVLHRVRRQDHGATALRDLAEELHDLFFGGRIET